MVDIQEPQKNKEEVNAEEAPLRTFTKGDLEVSTNVPIEINDLLCGGWKEITAPTIVTVADKTNDDVSPKQEQKGPQASTRDIKGKTIGKDK